MHRTPLSVVVLLGWLGVARAEAPAREAWRRVNEVRAFAGLEAVELDADMTAAAQAHAEYLALNRGAPALQGLAAHHEDATLPGYSEAGDKAGAASDIGWTGTPRESVDSWMATLYHRTPILTPSMRRIGYGTVPSSAEGVPPVHVLMFAFGTSDDAGPVAYPSDGQRDVPSAFASCGELPEPRPKDFARLSGYPISLAFGPGAALTGVSARLTDRDGKQLDVSVTSPETPASYFPQGGVISLMPRAILRPDMRYSVEVRASLNGAKAKAWRWSFTTRAALAPEVATLRSFAGLADRFVRLEGVVTNVWTDADGVENIYLRTAGGLNVFAQIPGDRLADYRRSLMLAFKALPTRTIAVEAFLTMAGSSLAVLTLEEPAQMSVVDL